MTFLKNLRSFLSLRLRTIASYPGKVTPLINDATIYQKYLERRLFLGFFMQMFISMSLSKEDFVVEALH